MAGMGATTTLSGGARRVQSIQALRGLAAAMVVVAHAIEHGTEPEPRLLGLSAHFGVVVFFVISGFVITHVAGDHRFDPLSFLKRRIIRVVPLYWALTFLVAGLAVVAPSIFKTTRFDLVYFIKSLLFLPALVPGTADDWRPLFKPGWTLNYEMFFYLVISLLFWCRSMRARVGLLSLSLGVLVLGSFFITRRAHWFSFYANLELLPFIGGTWLAVLWAEGRIQTWRPAIHLVVMVLTAALTIRFFAFALYPAPWLIQELTMMIAAILLVVAALRYEHYFTRHKASGWLGDISYSLYLVHMFVVGLGWAILHRFGIISVSPAGMIGLVLIVLASIATADISYRFFERPILRLGMRLERKPTTVR